MKDVDVLHQGHEVFECRPAVYYGPVLFDLAKVLGQQYAALCIALEIAWVKEDIFTGRHDISAPSASLIRSTHSQPLGIHLSWDLFLEAPL